MGTIIGLIIFVVVMILLIENPMIFIIPIGIILAIFIYKRKQTAKLEEKEQIEEIQRREQRRKFEEEQANRERIERERRRISPVTQTAVLASTSASPTVQPAHKPYKFPQQSENGDRLYKVYTAVNVCIIRDDPPDFNIVKQHFEKYTPITFIQEPENPYDKRAVALYLGNYKIGYMYKGTLNDMVNDFIRRGDFVTAILTDVSVSEKKAKMDMAFYKAWKNDGVQIKLAGTGSTAIQDNIYYCSAGDSVYIEYDDDKCKYIVLCGDDEIGYIPEAYEEDAEILENCNVAISEISENDSGKLVVTIAAI